MFEERLAAIMRRHAEPDTCHWNPDADDHFRTQCNKTFYLLAGTLAENGFVWCPYCRGRIEEGSC